MSKRQRSRLSLQPCLLAALLAAPAMAADPGADVSSPVERPDPLKTLAGELEMLKGLQFNGYVQPRFSINQSSKEGVGSDGRTPSNQDQFYVRRGRLSARYTGVRHAEVYLQIDATGAGVSLVDAEASLLAPWDDKAGRLTLGQTKIPFGVDIPINDADAEILERPQVITKLFPNIRDRGVKISYKVAFVRATLGVFNGNGTSDNATTFNYRTWTDKDKDGVMDPDEVSSTTKPGAALNFANADRDRAKDFAGRLGIDLGIVSAGGSFYLGRYANFAYEPVASTDPDTGITTYTFTEADGGTVYIAKTRFGGDLSVQLAALPIGKTVLRAEYIVGHGVLNGSQHDNRDVRGWYATLAQGITTWAQVAVRVDAYDPDTSEDLDETTAIEPTLNLFPTKNTKLTLAYQILRDHLDRDASGDRIDRENNSLTVQLQGRF
jgi:hypothetical protein